MRLIPIFLAALTVTPAAAQQSRPTPATPPAPVAPASPVSPARPPAKAAPAAPAAPVPSSARRLPVAQTIVGLDRLDDIRETLREARVSAEEGRRAAGFDLEETQRAMERAERASQTVSSRLDATRFALATTTEAMSGFGVAGRLSFAQSPRAAWAQQDVADSLYRQAREQLNRGDYRRAAALFKELPLKHPNSTYAADSPYWQAFALYRIGGTAELSEALAALEAQKAKYPTARTQSQADATTLATRIAGVLSSRGMGADAAVKRALSAGGDSCDREEQSVRAEALNALVQSDPESAQQLTKKILARKDECSVSLRKSAVFIIGNKRDPQAAATLIGVAKSDPSPDVRSDAVSWLSRVPGDEALGALEELAKLSDDERVQRAAVRALTTHTSPRARMAIRALVEKNDAPEQLRLTALDAFDRERMTADDAAWLRALYSKTDNTRIKGRIASAIGRLGGDANNQWLLAIAKNEDESIDARMGALSRAGENLDVAGLSKLYDGVSQRPLRETLINLLGMHKEAEATDKLLEIAKSGTDPQLRRFAINVLSRRKDPRTTKLLMELIER